MRKNAFWVVGLIGAITYFAICEDMAIQHPKQHNTLSNCIREIAKAFPFSVWIMGVFAGSLAFHLFQRKPE